jgi:CubicO group peptidase (beta-lactamase class C family)
VRAALFKNFGDTTPGCAVGIERAGRTPELNAFGVADLEHQVPISPETVFEVGSVSKQFTAATILVLADKGLLSLADDIRRFLPSKRRSMA